MRALQCFHIGTGRRAFIPAAAALRHDGVRADILFYARGQFLAQSSQTSARDGLPAGRKISAARRLLRALGAWRELLSAGRGTASGDGSAGRIICVSVFAVSGIHGHRSGTGPAVAAKKPSPAAGKMRLTFAGKNLMISL